MQRIKQITAVVTAFLLLPACGTNSQFSQVASESQVISSGAVVGAAVSSDDSESSQESEASVIAEKRQVEYNPLNQNQTVYHSMTDRNIPRIIAVTGGSELKELEVPAYEEINSGAELPYFKQLPQTVMLNGIRNYHLLAQYVEYNDKHSKYYIIDLKDEQEPVKIDNAELPPPYFLTDTTVVSYPLARIPAMLLLDCNGEKTPFQLHYNYGEILNDDANAGQISKWNTEPQYALKRLLYDAQGKRYFATGNFIINFNDGSDEGAYISTLIIFNNAGWEINRVDLDEYYTDMDTQLFLLEPNSLLITNVSWDGGHMLLVNLSDGTYNILDNESVIEMIKQYPEYVTFDAENSLLWNPQVAKATPPCPVTVEYDEDGTKIYAQDEQKTLLKTLDARYYLECYTWDEAIPDVAYLIFREPLNNQLLQ